jgi:hypothetical protein
VKKLLILLGLAGLAWAVYRAVGPGAEARSTWNQVTDTVA